MFNYKNGGKKKRIAGSTTPSKPSLVFKEGGVKNYIPLTADPSDVFTGELGIYLEDATLRVNQMQITSLEYPVREHPDYSDYFFCSSLNKQNKNEFCVVTHNGYGENFLSIYMKINGDLPFKSSNQSQIDIDLGDEFPYYCSFDGDYIAFGLSRFGGDPVLGSVKILHRTDSGWNSWTTIFPEGIEGESGDQFGLRVDLDGDFLAIGMPYLGYYSTLEAGGVFVYKRTGENIWEKCFFSYSLNPSRMFHYGGFVAISGNYLAASEITGIGRVIIHEKDSEGIWGSGVLLREGESNEVLGSSVSFLGDSLAIGGAINIYIYIRTGPGVWELTQTLTPTIKPYSVSMTEKMIIAGGENGNGSIYFPVDGAWDEETAIYYYSGSLVNYRAVDDMFITNATLSSSGSFGNVYAARVMIGEFLTSERQEVIIKRDAIFRNKTEREEITGGDDITTDYEWGVHFEIDGDYMAIAAVHKTAGGIIYIFQKNQYGEFVDPYIITADSSHNHFGYKIDLSGDYLIVGDYAKYEDNEGGAYIYHRTSGNIWDEMQTLTSSVPGIGNFGFAVSIEGEFASVSSPLIELVDIYKRNLLGLYDWSSSVSSPDYFISSWNTNNGLFYKDRVDLPLVSNGTYDFTIYWGDGNSNKITSWNQAEKIHVYSTPGVYAVRIIGQIEGWSFESYSNFCDMIGMVSSWGTLCLGDTTGQFKNCKNLTFGESAGAPDLSKTSSFYNAFSGTQLPLFLNNWDTSLITNLNHCFDGSKFNSSLSNWNTSLVTQMVMMFWMNSSFNQNISSWDVSSVKNMEAMFGYATAFDQDLSGWKTNAVTSMSAMFMATNCNFNVSGWNTSLVTNFLSLFRGNPNFNQDLSSWNVSKGTELRYMFRDSLSFDQDLSAWDVTGITDLSGFFENTGLSVDNYSKTLIGWAAKTVQQNVTLVATGLKYNSLAVTARDTLVNTYNWDITDSGLED